jgi:hypothetical protein
MGDYNIPFAIDEEMLNRKPIGVPLMKKMFQKQVTLERADVRTARFRRPVS